VVVGAAVDVLVVVLVLVGVVVDDVVLVAAWPTRPPGVEMLGPELPQAARARTPTVVSASARAARRRVEELLSTVDRPRRLRLSMVGGKRRSDRAFRQVEDRRGAQPPLGTPTIGSD
jgi:hypothetical protein